MSHEMFDTLAGVYALGALEGEERTLFEEHYTRGCDRCDALVRETEEALASVARAQPPMVPPPHVKTALLQRIAADAPAAAPSRRRTAERPRTPWLRWAVATAAAAIAAAAFTGTFVASRYEARLGQMARETAALRQRLQRDEAALRDQVALYRGAIDLLRDPATRVVTLGGLDAAPQAIGRVIWNEASGGHLFVANLPPAPPDKVYELWTIGEGAPRPAGLFTVDASGAASHRVPPAPGQPVKVFAVTLEPAGGVPAPTGPMVLASK